MLIVSIYSLYYVSYSREFYDRLSYCQLNLPVTYSSLLSIISLSYSIFYFKLELSLYYIIFKMAAKMVAIDLIIRYNWAI